MYYICSMSDKFSVPLLDMAFDSIVGLIEQTPAVLVGAVGLGAKAVGGTLDIVDRGLEGAVEATGSLGGGIGERCAAVLEGLDIGGLNLGQSIAQQPECGMEGLGEMPMQLATVAPQRSAAEFFMSA